MSADEAVYRPDFDLGDFRYAIAGYVKFLVRARWKCEPGFLSPVQLAVSVVEARSSDYSREQLSFPFPQSSEI